MSEFYIFFFICCLLFSFLINALFVRFSLTLGIRDKKETVIRWGSTSKPSLGGIAFYIVFLISLASYAMFFEAQQILLNKKIVGLLGTTTLAFLMGLADDAYNTRPLLKLFVQVLCGAILCYSGIYIAMFPNMELNYALTVIWVVGIMNSLNMLDNMDAIASIVSIFIFAAAIFLLLFAGLQSNILFLILLGIIGALMGFLVFNWHPAKLFMGDTGSQTLGLLLATTGIIFFWNDSTFTSETYSVSKQITMVFIAFLLPLTDTFVVVINRLSRKKSPFIGGRDHTTHALFYLGVTEKRVALLFAAIGLLNIFFVYLVQHVIGKWKTEYLFYFALYALSVFLFLFLATRLKKNIVSGKNSLNGSGIHVHSENFVAGFTGKKQEHEKLL